MHFAKVDNDHDNDDDDVDDDHDDDDGGDDELSALLLGKSDYCVMMTMTMALLKIVAAIDKILSQMEVALQHTLLYY